MKEIQKELLSWKRSVVMGAIALSAGFYPVKVNGTGLLFQFDNIFSGTVPPAGPSPWVDATFQDTANGVLLTVNNVGLSAGEFLSALYLNIDPADNVNNLTFTFENGTSGVDKPTIQTGENSFKADGDGKYDILFSFATASSGRFGAGDSFTYLISGITGLTSTSFEFLSEPAGGHGPFYAAGHIQGIGSSGDSDWIEPSAGPILTPVPEPSSAAVMVLAAGLFGATRLRLHRTHTRSLLSAAKLRRDDHGQNQFSS